MTKEEQNEKQGQIVALDCFECLEPNQSNSNSQSLDENITKISLEVKTSNLPGARENASDQVAIGFSFEFDWLKKWRQFFGTIT